MTQRLTPYGSAEQVQNIAKVGKPKTPESLATRMPSPEIAAKVGPISPQVSGIGVRRLVRRSAQG